MAKLAVRRIKIEAQSKPYINRKVKKNIGGGLLPLGRGEDDLYARDKCSQAIKN